MIGTDSDEITDVMNGTAYTYEKNTFNLALFADAASYTESRNMSMWAVFSTVLELHPSLRCKNENVIFHSSWTGSNPEINLFLGKYNKQISQILSEGIEFEGSVYSFKIHLFIADAPARAK